MGIASSVIETSASTPIITASALQVYYPACTPDTIKAMPRRDSPQTGKTYDEQNLITNGSGPDRSIRRSQTPDGSFIGGVAAGRTVGPICMVGEAVAGHPKGISVMWSPGIGAHPRPKGFRPYEIRVS
jgi:hypothetical protein